MEQVNLAAALPAAAPKHPKGLWVLFGTEMWERFNFYGMRTLLTLFIVNALGFSESNSSIIYGGFLGLCYLTPMLGGFIADKFLGNRYCIMLGGLLMAIGQFFLFFSAIQYSTNVSFATTLLYVALGFLIFGNGFFKPNISSMVGSLYPKAEKNKLDSAFTIFYMGINLGAFLGQLLCPILGDSVDSEGVRNVAAFKWGFLAAGIAMLIGTITFYLLKDKYVVTPEGKAIGDLPKKSSAEDFEDEAQNAKFTSTSLAIAGALFVALFFVFFKVFGQNIIYSLIYGGGIALATLILTDKSLTKVETQRIWVIYIVSFFVIFFWAAFEQAGSSLTFIADKQTDRNFFGWNMPPSMVQIFNGIFVVMFAVPFSLLWDRLRAKGKEPISPFKQAIGLALIALSYFIIANNVQSLGLNGLLAVKWLILLYLIQTFGELCLSPIGLSLVGKLSPKRFASLLMGVWFLSNASGYALAGTLGSIVPPSSKEYKTALAEDIDYQAILDGKKSPTGAEMFTLAKLGIGNTNFKLAKANGLDLEELVKSSDSSLNPKQYKTLKEAKVFSVPAKIDSLLSDTVIKKKLKSLGYNAKEMLAKQANIKGEQWFNLAKIGVVNFDNNLAKAKGFDLNAIYAKKAMQPTAAQLQLIKDKNLAEYKYPSFGGVTITNLYQFFMVFVVLCGVASIILMLISPMLKRMMNGIS
jgi:proton-dependent oligopeptide transporter, POT family